MCGVLVARIKQSLPTRNLKARQVTVFLKPFRFRTKRFVVVAVGFRPSNETSFQLGPMLMVLCSTEFLRKLQQLQYLCCTSFFTVKQSIRLVDGLFRTLC